MLLDQNSDPAALAAQNSFARAILGRMLPQGAQGLLGAGMAQSAAGVLQSIPYQKHVQEMRALGQQPMDPQQFQQMMMQAPSKPSWLP